MLTSLRGNDDGANSDLKSKVINALEPVLKENWPKIEPYADKALAAAQDDTVIENLARTIYPWLPMVVRFALKEDKFVAFTLENKAPLLAKLSQYKAEHGS